MKLVTATIVNLALLGVALSDLPLWSILLMGVGLAMMVYGVIAEAEKR